MSAHSQHSPAVGKAFTRRALLRLKSFESLRWSLAVSKEALNETEDKEMPFIVAEPLSEEVYNRVAVSKIDVSNPDKDHTGTAQAGQQSALELLCCCYAGRQDTALDRQPNV